MDSTETLSGRVAEQIRRELGGSNVTKSELARRLGVSHTWVINRLTGHQDISLNEVEQIAAALGVEVGELLPKPAYREGGGPSSPRRNTYGLSERPDRATRRRHVPAFRHADQPSTTKGEPAHAGRVARRPAVQAWRHSGVTA